MKEVLHRICATRRGSHTSPTYCLGSIVNIIAQYACNDSGIGTDARGGEPNEASVAKTAADAGTEALWYFANGDFLKQKFTMKPWGLWDPNKNM